MYLRKIAALLLVLVLTLSPLPNVLADGEDTTSMVVVEIHEGASPEEQQQVKNVGNVDVDDSSYALVVSVNEQGEGAIFAKDVTATNTEMYDSTAVTARADGAEALSAAETDSVSAVTESGYATGVSLDAANAGQVQVDAGDVSAASQQGTATGLNIDAATGGQAVLTAESVTASSEGDAKGVQVISNDSAVTSAGITEGIQANGADSVTGVFMWAEGVDALATVSAGGDIAAQSSEGAACGACITVIDEAQAELLSSGDISAQGTRAQGAQISVSGEEGRSAQASLTAEGNVWAMADSEEALALDVYAYDGVVEASVGGFVSGVAYNDATAATGAYVVASTEQADAVVMLNVQGGIYAYGEDATALKIETQGESGVSVVSGDDVYGEKTGISVTVDGAPDSIDILVNGTVSGEDTAVRLSGEGAEDAVNLTVWAVEGPIVGEDGADAEAFTQRIQYIIKIGLNADDGTVVLDGTTNYEDFDVATAGTTVTVLPTLAEGCTLLGVSNDGSALAQNEDGNYFIEVPQGGGVYLTFDMDISMLDAYAEEEELKCLGKIRAGNAMLKFYNNSVFELIVNGETSLIGRYGFPDGRLNLRAHEQVSLLRNVTGSLTIILKENVFTVEKSDLEGLQQP